MALNFTVIAFDDKDLEVNRQEWPAFTPFIGASYYKIGTASKVMRVWTPFSAESGGSDVGREIINAMGYFMNDNLDGQGNPVVSFELKLAGWGGVASDPICNSRNECADIIILGTTQVAGRVAQGQTHSLNEYFNEYASENGQQFADNFITKYVYDFFYGDQWMGIPMVTDFRSFFFNRTTFDALGLKYPPPHADWGPDYTKTWTWKKVVEYAVAIKASGRESGFKLNGIWDEELKWLTAASREYKSQILTGNLGCGYNTDAFQNFLTDIVEPLYGPNGAAENGFIDENSPEFIKWKNEPLGDPTQRPFMGGKDDTDKIPGLAYYSIFD